MYGFVCHCVCIYVVSVHVRGVDLKALEDLSDVSDDLDDRINRLQADHINLLRQALKR